MAIGGDNSLVGGEYRQGVFANHPAMTPKYGRDLEYMARFMVPFAKDSPARWDFVKAVPSNALPLASALATDGEIGFGYIDFLLQQVQESYQEKVQVVDVLSDNYVSYCFGQNPPVFNYTGTLYNSIQDDWRAAFTVLYQEMLRATKLARQKQVVILAYDDVLVTGVLLSMSQTLTAEMQVAATFNFQILVKRYDVNQRVTRMDTFAPTELNTYPFKIQPDGFASPTLQTTDATQWAAPAAIYTTKQREQPTDAADGTEQLATVPTSDEKYIQETLYNAMTAPRTSLRYQVGSRVLLDFSNNLLAPIVPKE